MRSAAISTCVLFLIGFVPLDLAATVPAEGAVCPSEEVPANSADAASKPATVRVAGIVLKWIRGDKGANLRRIEPMIREAAAGGAKIVVTTECFLDGYAIADKSIPLPTYRALGEPIPDGHSCRRLAALADELDLHLVAGMLEADGDARYNTAVLLGPDGSIVQRTILGDRLLIPKEQAGSEVDPKRVFYLDVPIGPQ